MLTTRAISSSLLKEGTKPMSNTAAAVLQPINKDKPTETELGVFFALANRAYFTNNWQFVKCNKDTARAIASKCITKGYWFRHQVCDHNPKFHMFILPFSIDFSKDIQGNSKCEFVATVIPGEHMTQDKFSGKAAA